MIVLVDYDNLPRRERDKGLVYLAERIVEVVTARQTPTSGRISLKIYGGWYGRGALTPRGQALSAEATANFPRVVSLPDGRRVPIGSELAYGLEIEPTRHLWRTYRPREPALDVMCHTPMEAGCTNTSCPLVPMEAFITSGVCSAAGCSIGVPDFLYRTQQKLVDTMLTADLIHLALADSRNICLVSSDHDLWPGVRTALILGRPLVHVHTRHGESTPAYYSTGSGAGYIQTVF